MTSIVDTFDVVGVCHDPEKIGKAFAYLREFALHIHFDIENNNSQEYREVNFRPITKSEFLLYKQTCELFGSQPLIPNGWSV